MTPARAADRYVVRNTAPGDFPAVIDLTRIVYPDTPPWREDQLASHRALFPEGQFVAAERASGRIVAMAASLIVLWDDYDMGTTWRDFTANGMFTNHDPVNGRTLYAAEVMVHPSCQGRGVGTLIYASRHDLARRLGLLRIRAGARLRGYHRYADRMSADEYVRQVRRKSIWDPTLSFQMRRGYRVVAVVSGYLRHDAESLGHAAVIEWLNPDLASAIRTPPHRAPRRPPDDPARTKPRDSRNEA